jgi:hypothetical protein
MFHNARRAKASSQTVQEVLRLGQCDIWKCEWGKIVAQLLQVYEPHDPLVGANEALK